MHEASDSEFPSGSELASRELQEFAPWFGLESPLTPTVALLSLALVWFLCLLRALDACVELQPELARAPEACARVRSLRQRWRGVHFALRYLEVRRFATSRLRDTMESGDRWYRLLLWMLASEISGVLLVTGIALNFTTSA